MEIQLILITALSLAAVLPLIGYIVHIIDRKDKIKCNTGASMYVKQSKRNSWYRIYLFLGGFFLTKSYIDKVSRRYEMLCPGDIKRVAAKTMKVVFITWLLCALEISIIYFMKPNLHNGALSIILVFIINNEVLNAQVSNAEIKLLEGLAIFISDIRHNYHINRMVDDAILSSIEGLDFELKQHANRLYEIVISNNLKDDVIRYNTTTHNKYLRMLLALCTGVIEFSDKKINGQLLFTTNLQHLKREISIEILKLKKLKHVFSGTIFVTVAVCLPIDAIQRFGISLVPELGSFYSGRGGILFVCAIFLSSVMIYLLVNSLKEIKRLLPGNNRYLKKLEKLRFIKKALDNYTEKNYRKILVMKDILKRIGETISPRQLLLKRMVAGTITFGFCIGLVFIMHYNNRQNIICRIDNIDSLIPSTGKNQKELIVETILNYLNQYKECTVTEEQLLEELTEAKAFYNTHINEIISKEVIVRAKKYQTEYLKWYEVAICFGITLIAFYTPYWMILYKKGVLRLNMEDEVNQYNSIIYMMMFIDHITVKDLLEQMELFAIVFKQSIQECINDYNSGDIEALSRMKGKESYGPFMRLVDNLIRCDTIPIDKAFDEIASDRENYHDRRKQENEISIQKRADIAKPLSFIPAVLVTIYLLLPLLYASLKELDSFKDSLSSMGF